MALLSNMTFAQTTQRVGGGYFGHTVTHPGIVLEYELEKHYSEKASTPLRVNLGFYSHPRNHVGLFLDLNYGVRRTFASGLFVEQSIGVGVLETILNGEGVYETGEDGTVGKVSRWNSPDLMPSITLGLGYNLTRHSEKKNLIWIRPKISWQFPHKTTATFHPAVQVGFTHEL